LVDTLCVRHLATVEIINIPIGNQLRRFVALSSGWDTHADINWLDQRCSRVVNDGCCAAVDQIT